ncbi:hypothetical protein [Paenibacillus sp. TH7-28]
MIQGDCGKKWSYFEQNSGWGGIEEFFTVIMDDRGRIAANRRVIKEIETKNVVIFFERAGTDQITPKITAISVQARISSELMIVHHYFYKSIMKALTCRKYVAMM